MKISYALAIALATIVGAGVFIGGAMATTNWPSMWSGHMFNGPRSMGDHWDEEECHAEGEDWGSHMHDHMGDHWDEEECHVEGEDWGSHMHDHMGDQWDEEECHVEEELPI